jgi:hypothetical protein
MGANSGRIGGRAALIATFKSLIQLRWIRLFAYFSVWA